MKHSPPCPPRSVWLTAITCVLASLAAAAGTSPSPNIVLFFCDDLGYADVGCYGAKGWTTPNLDRLAAAGTRFTQFHVAQPVCSASRAALLTGCYPNRLGIHGALGPNARTGLSDREMTLAELVKQRGYATAIVGKWHLGSEPQFLPTRHGFDDYLGLPYSNDMWPRHPEARPGTYPPLPLLDGERVVDADVSPETQATLTTRYTERAVQFVERNRQRPFLLYLAYTMPHVPLFVSDRFKGKSDAGLYGDVVMEIDWSVGEVLAALRRCGLERNTLVLFTSDNGPWLSYGNHAGSAGPWREGKGTVFEGGTRVPCIARWPGRIPAGRTCGEMAMTIDLFPTIARLVGAALPRRQIDGLDIWPLLAGESGAGNPHTAYFHYYARNELQAVRSGPWKLLFPHTARTMMGHAPGRDGQPGQYQPLRVGLELYNLVSDPGETLNLADHYPDVVKRLQGYAEEARNDLGDSLTGRTGSGLRPAGRAEASPDAARN